MECVYMHMSQELLSRSTRQAKGFRPPHLPYRTTIHDWGSERVPASRTYGTVTKVRRTTSPQASRSAALPLSLLRSPQS